MNEPLPGDGRLEASLASTASLIGNSSRAAMLLALLEGRALTAGELAHAALIAPQTASGHLARLIHGGLLAFEPRGRHRYGYYRIANAEVAFALETLSAISPRPTNERGRSSVSAVRCMRTCYDHLAGQLGVRLTDELVGRGLLLPVGREFDLSEMGREWFASFGIDADGARRSRRKLAPACLDWTERRHHVGGALGAALATRFFEMGWIARVEGSRALRVTVPGRIGLQREFRIAL